MGKRSKTVRTFGPNNAPTAGDQILLIPAGTIITAGGNSSALTLFEQNTLKLTLNVTAATGTTPSLTVNVQDSPDGTTWTTRGSFTARTTAGSERKVFSGLDDYVRANWTVTGTTPSFTVSLSGSAT